MIIARIPGYSLVFQEKDANVVVYRDADGKAISAMGADLDPLPDPLPGPLPGPMVPITLGNWRGNFLFDQVFYFSPSLLAWSAAMRREFFTWTKAQGSTHVWINGQQDNWQPLYTRGGFDCFQSDVSLDHLVAVLIETRTAGLIPCLSLHDQRQTIEMMDQGGGLAQLISEDQRVIDATHEHVAMYMGLTWEINEVPQWRIGQDRNPAIRRYCREVNTHGRHVGFHWAPRYHNGNPDVQGGFQLWNHLPPHAVRLQQWPKRCDDAELRDLTEQAVVVAEATGHGICIFEHSRPDYPDRPGGGQDLAEAARRAQVCADVVGNRIPLERFGRMNG